MNRRLFKHFPKEKQRDNGVLKLMTCAKGYVMVRHKGCAPFVLSEKEWLDLPDVTQPSDAPIQSRLRDKDAASKA